jgi:DNA-nicking Smr family endonuclease
MPRFQVGQSAIPQPSRLPRLASPAERLASADLRMDAKTHRKISQGKIRPEARLDLHGMTLAAAQPELMHFIMSCHTSGLRLVLVITGKGRGDYGPLPTRPGALRHQVPYWLHSPPLSMVVQQVSASHYRHGGEGAYYVYLRRHP